MYNLEIISHKFILLRNYKNFKNKNYMIFIFEDIIK